MIGLKQVINALKTIGKLQWLALAACIGILLLLGMKTGDKPESIYTNEELRIASILNGIEGVKDINVMISYDAQAERSGIVVVADGAINVRTALEIQRAVKTLTGLKLEQIEIVNSNCWE